MQQAKVIAIFNQKGGSGKSTMAMNLAADFSARSMKVLVVDLDPQGTALVWASSAPEDRPFPATVISMAKKEHDEGASGGRPARRNLANELRSFINIYDIILLDLPGSMESTAPDAALLVADLVIIPMPPAAVDMWAMAPIYQLVERAAVFNPKLRAAIAFTLVYPRETVSTTVMDEVKNSFGGRAQILDAYLENRAAFRKSQVQAGSVFDVDDVAVHKMVASLGDEVIGLLIQEVSA